MKNNNGFTLIEVLLVIAILAILAGIVIIAINPQKQVASARDAQRSSDVYAILSAVHQYAVDHEGELPGNLSEDYCEICRTTSDSCIGLCDLSALTINEEYLVSMPIDPLCPIDGAYCDDNGTGYTIQVTENGRIRVNAPDVELRDEIVAEQ